MQDTTGRKNLVMSVFPFFEQSASITCILLNHSDKNDQDPTKKSFISFDDGFKLHPLPPTMLYIPEKIAFKNLSF